MSKKKAVTGPDGTVYGSLAAAAAYEGVTPIAMRERCKRGSGGWFFMGQQRPDWRPLGASESTATDMLGMRVGQLVVTGRSQYYDGKGAYWQCKCDCGNTCVVRGNHLRRSGKRQTKSCGCRQRENNRINAIVLRTIPAVRREMAMADD